MCSQAYRINKISVTSFRGITDTRTVEVSGRHLFLLGPNGYGKSTVVEAVRWCMFGSPQGQQEIEVRNTFSPAKASEVALDLVAKGKVFNIRRNLNPGATQSRIYIADDSDKNYLVQDLFPQLTRLGQPTGTQVIFAAQHAAGRRQAEITDFSKVLYFYLGIERIPDLLEKLRKVTEERRVQREEMSKSLDSFLQELRNKLSLLQGQRNEILKNPPWGEASTPTRLETNRKVDNFINEIVCLKGAYI